MTLAPMIPEDQRELALLKAVGLDRLAPEQRELALHIAARYELDLMLKHLVMIDGRPYITRDGLLHIAHRSGVLDGIETTVPEVVNEEWRVSCSVYRKDMSRPFTYAGRYPTKGGNQKFAPEMATKVAESMSLRRAFDVAAPTQDERWDLDVAAPPSEPPPSLAEKAAAKAAEVMPPADADAERNIMDADGFRPDGYVGRGVENLDKALKSGRLATSPAQDMETTRCESVSPWALEGEPPRQCARETGHPGHHKNHESESWA